MCACFIAGDVVVIAIALRPWSPRGEDTSCRMKGQKELPDSVVFTTVMWLASRDLTADAFCDPPPSQLFVYIHFMG